MPGLALAGVKGDISILSTITPLPAALILDVTYFPPVTLNYDNWPPLNISRCITCNSATRVNLHQNPTLYSCMNAWTAFKVERVHLPIPPTVKVPSLPAIAMM